MRHWFWSIFLLTSGSRVFIAKISCRVLADLKGCFGFRSMVLTCNFLQLCTEPKGAETFSTQSFGFWFHLAIQFLS